MLGYYNYTVYLTYVGLISAVFGMMEALQRNPRVAVLCLMFCGLCDMFDGTIARTHKTRTDDEKSFGIQIDSLCDLVCFGIFPVVIGFSIGVKSVFGVICMAFYALAAVIRLGYFNVQEINRTKETTEKRKYYTGLPVTSIAILLPTFLLLDIPTKFSMVRLYSLCLLFVGIAFISKIKIKKPYFYSMIVCALFGVVIFFLFYRFGGRIGW
ncbi:MAG: CDP-alcohol phosphatidyltransferase family protein [Lachnospirales bacterium]